MQEGDRSDPAPYPWRSSNRRGAPSRSACRRESRSAFHEASMHICTCAHTCEFPYISDLPHRRKRMQRAAFASRLRETAVRIEPRCNAFVSRKTTMRSYRSVNEQRAKPRNFRKCYVVTRDKKSLESLSVKRFWSKIRVSSVVIRVCVNKKQQNYRSQYESVSRRCNNNSEKLISASVR